MKKNKEKETKSAADIPAEEKIDAGETPVESNEAAAENQSAEEQIKKLEQELSEAKDKLLYLQAEYQNFRRRTAKDITDARSYAVADTLTPFLTVFDYLSMAETAANKSDNIEAIRQGLQMIISQFFKTFEELGVRKFESVGKDFDPQLHDAVSNEPSEEAAEGKILKEWCCGFKIGEKLLRPARVVVSSGPEKKENSGDVNQQEKAE